jgi:hypothetical protein
VSGEPCLETEALLAFKNTMPSKSRATYLINAYESVS